ncbi:MAG: hypothetical protein ACK5MF_06315 [Vibrio sp.]|uniref:hypothetical protein n=1 Tax=Vibrio sp. TaxID=678 RepID=UPI003A89D754
MTYYVHNPHRQGIVVSSLSQEGSEHPRILKQPESITAIVDESISFSVVAENYVSIYWQESSCALTPCWYDADFLPNWQTETLGPWHAALDSSGFQYRTVIIGRDGCEVYSDAAVLTVTE